MELRTQKIIITARNYFLRHRLFYIALNLFLVPVTAFARAGGGGGFGGSGGSGGGGGGELIFYIICSVLRLAIHYPVVGIPMLISVGIILYYTSKAGFFEINSYHQSSSIRRNKRQQTKEEREIAMSKIKERDPDFDENRLIERTQKAFTAIQKAWYAQDLKPVQAFISDGILERFSLQFEEQREEGYRDHMENIQIHNCHIARVKSSRVFDMISVRITASAVDYRVDINSGLYISGSKSPALFVEYWSFIRRPGTRSVKTSGLWEGNCPNCGADLKLNQHAKCSACGSLVKNGEYDWILSEITQPSEWLDTDYKEIPGVKQLTAADPGFSTQHLEDRASVIFWRLMKSEREGTIKPIRKMATERFCKELADKLKPDQDGFRIFQGECAVGSVDTTGVLLTPEFDKAAVYIQWSGSARKRSSEKTISIATESIKSHFYILIRKHGTLTDSAHSASSGHCPGCSAPVQSAASDACEYCGTVLNDGSTEWILDSVGSRYKPDIMELLTAIRKTSAQTDAAFPEEPSGKLELAAWMALVMMADEKVTEKEQKLMFSYASANNIPEQKIRQIMTAARNKTLSMSAPKDPQQGHNWLTFMIRTAMADGFIDKREQDAIRTLGRKLNMSNADIRRMIQNVRKDEYRKLARIRKTLHQSPSG